MEGVKRDILMIPGPIEFTNEVLNENGQRSLSHTDPAFIEIFSRTIKQMRKVFVTEHGQPFIIAGSGTLGWDMVAANLVEPHEDVLVISTGYFGDGFADCLNTYGAQVSIMSPAIPGDVPSFDEIESKLKSQPESKKFRLITITHVDTSTGVKSDVKRIAEIVRKTSPDTLIIVDGVCATGAEELQMDAWGVDVVITASQKALGCPPGLSIATASKRSIERLQSRKVPVANYYANWNRWLPIMKSYEDCKPSYFATPAVNLICALHVSLNEVLSKGIEARWKLHEVTAKAVKEAVKSFGLNTVPARQELQSNALTTIWYPDGLDGDKLRNIMKREGIVIAGGLHKDIKTKYFRIGTMGKSISHDNAKDLRKTIEALEIALTECGYTKFTSGAAIKHLNELFSDKQASNL